MGGSVSSYVCNSTLATWRVIETWDSEVPDEIRQVIRKDQKDHEEGYVYSLMWQDAFLYHGEDGWVLNDETLTVAEEWLEAHREEHGLARDSCFWFRVKRS
jgi:hypothetical protein